MYSILIVDDEDIIRQGLKKVVDWNALGYTIAGAVSNGEKALEFLSRQKVDVVLADIRMPRMSGIELARELKQQHPSVKTVILSGYDNFEYAREAIEHNVFSYLLKPCREHEILDVFSRMKRLLDQDRKKEKEALLAEKLILKRALSVLLSGESNQQAGDTLSEWPPFRAGNSVHTLLFQVYQDSDTSSCVHQLEEFLDAASLQPCTLTVLLEQDMMALLLPEDPGQHDCDPDSVFRMVLEHSGRSCEAALSAAEGPAVSCPGELYDSFQQAESLLCHRLYLGLNRLIQAKDVSGDGSRFPEELSRKLGECAAEDFREGDESLLMERLDQLHAELEKCRLMDRSSVLQVFRSFFSVFSDALRNSGIRCEQFTGSTESLFSEMSGLQTLEQMFFFLSARLQEGLRIYSRIRQSSTSAIIRQAVSLIHEEYSKDISLENAAGRLGITPSYLSRLFKKELGENFRNYLSSVRMEEAKRLLARSNGKVYEIAERVGYNDQHYFSETFKKATGVSPLEFRRLAMENPS